MAARLPALQLSLQFSRLSDAAAHRAALPRAQVMRWIRHALQRPAEITVRIVDAEEGLALNRDYRHKAYATNVLTFDYAQSPVVMADLVLCARSGPASKASHCGTTTRICWCTAACMPRDGTMKPAPPMPKSWRPEKLPSWQA